MAGVYSIAEKQFRLAMIVFCVGCVGFAALFAFAPDGFVTVINWIGGLFSEKSISPLISKISLDKYQDIFYDKSLGLPGDTKLPPHGLYIIHSVSLMLLMAIACGLAAYEPRKYRDLALLPIGYLTFDFVLGLAYYLWSYPYFANLGVALIDGPLAVVLLVFYLRARSSKTPAAPTVAGGAH
ncbi:MAG TPA: hypothetical protein PK961_11090 [bacterium]|nr:hypothetical protein [bacterium]